MANKNWHIYDLNTLEKKLNTDYVDGISVREARKRLDAAKKREKGNVKSLFVADRKPIILGILSFLLSPFTVLLIIMAFLTCVFGEPVLGASVLIISLSAAFIGGFLSVRAERRLESMREYASPMVSLKRGGNIFKTDGRNVVEGDIILLKTGDLMPCDARIIKSEALIVEEIVATGNGIVKRKVAKNADVLYEKDSDVADPDAENMLYAGSAIVGGSAIAVVCSVGTEMYLSDHLADGALGGKDTEPEGVKKLQPLFYKTSFICAAVMLILSLLGLLTLRGKESFICVFTMLLSTVFFISVELLNNGSKEIVSSYIKRIASHKTDSKQKNSFAAIRNVKALDTLSGVTDLVLVGRAGLCEGLFHISSVYTADVVLSELNTENPVGNDILTYIYTYVRALKESNVENSFTANGYADGLYAYVKQCGFDINGASLAIKSLYFANNFGNEKGFACAETDRACYKVSLQFDESILKLCKYIRENSRIREFTPEDMQNIRTFRNNSFAQGLKCLYLVTETEKGVVFEGVITLTQMFDEALYDTVKQLEELNVYTTVLLANEDEYTKSMIENPAISHLFSEVAYASEFRKKGKAITEDIGYYSAYIGFKNDEYEELLVNMRKQGSRIAAYGVSNDTNAILARADIAISCDVLNYASEKYIDSVYERIPPEGRDTNVRCSQQTRHLSKVIVKRVNETGGGIPSVLKSIRVSRSAYVAITQAMQLFIMLMSILVTFSAMSVITGNVLLDPLQTTALSSVFAILSITVFSEAKHKNRILSGTKDFINYPIEMTVKRTPAIIARMITAASLAVAIKILDVVGVFGEKPAYTLPVFLCMCLTLFAELFISNYTYSKKSEVSSTSWLKVLVAYAVLLGICAVSTMYPFADMFYENGFGSFEYLIIPAYALMYAISLLIVHLIGKKRKK